MSETDAFIKRVESELRELNRREKKVIDQEDVLRKQRTELRSRAAELTKSLGVYRQVMGVDTTLTPAAVAERPIGAEGTIADIAASVLEARGGPMSTNEIAAELRRVGKLKGGGASGRADYGTVYRTLLRDARFSRVDKGVFGLAAPKGG